MIPRHWQRVPRLDSDRYTLVDVARDIYGPENVRRQDMDGDDLFWRTPEATYFVFWDLKQKTHLLKIDKEGEVTHYPKKPLRFRLHLHTDMPFEEVLSWTVFWVLGGLYLMGNILYWIKD